MIVVTAPTGVIGGQVLARLLEADAPIRVIVRDPNRLAPEFRARVEVIEGSHGDREVVNRAFAGADALFWLVPAAPHAPSLEAAYVDFTRPAAAAITEQGVGHVVSISALGRGTTLPAGHVAASWAMDDLLASTGVNFRALTMPSFMDNVLRQMVPIRDQGVYSLSLSGDRKLPVVATRDIAAVAAVLLLDTSWTGQEAVPVLGPEDLSQDDMAAIMSEVLGRPVRYQQVSHEAYKEARLRMGVSEIIAQGLVEMAAAKNEGIDNLVARTPETSTPTTFRQWCEDTLKPAVLA
ncbi:MAG: NmrA family NAD(P)-binding protein [Thermomicrobiales bacterium]